jgi:hypothetical protein
MEVQSMAKTSQSSAKPATIHDQKLTRGAGGEVHQIAEATARDFVADASASCKFMAFTLGSIPLLQKASVDPEADEDLIAIDDPQARRQFIGSCRNLRLLELLNGVSSSRSEHIEGVSNANCSNRCLVRDCVDGEPILRVPFCGEGGDCVTVDMASIEAGNDDAAVDRARAILLQTATFGLAANDYNARSNGNFDEVVVTNIGNENGGVYIFEYRDGEGSRQVPPSRMPSLEAAREEAIRCAIDLLVHDLEPGTNALTGWLVRVRDEKGELLCTIDVQEADAARQTRQWSRLPFTVRRVLAVTAASYDQAH